MRNLLIWSPLGLFLLVLALVAGGLIRPADRDVHSAMVGKPLPAIALPPLIPGKPGVESARLPHGKPFLVNVFASWCVPCAAESPQLAQLRNRGIAIVGIATADRTPDLQDFLARNGDPFAAIGDDRRRETQLALGSAGVPETFVVDARGRIALQHIGYIGPQDLPDIVAALDKAQ